MAVQVTNYHTVNGQIECQRMTGGVRGKNLDYMPDALGSVTVCTDSSQTTQVNERYFGYGRHYIFGLSRLGGKSNASSVASSG